MISVPTFILIHFGGRSRSYSCRLRERDHRGVPRQTNISICGHALTSDSFVHKIGVWAADRYRHGEKDKRGRVRWTKAAQGE